MNTPPQPNAAIDVIRFFGTHATEFEEFATPAEKCVEGKCPDGPPLQRTWNLFASPDGRFFAGTWEAEPGCWQVNYTEHEYCRILSGRSILRDRAGAERVLAPGDEFVIPAGFAGQWEVVETTRKIYVIYQS